VNAREKSAQDAGLALAGGIDHDAVLAQLDSILASQLFQHSRRYPAFLGHVVRKALEGASEELKERSLGVAVFRRPAEYDTSADPVVRNTASEVRKRLEEYYSDPAHAGELRISLPVGAYVPVFRTAPAAIVPEPPAESPALVVQPSRRWIGIACAAVLTLAAVAVGIRLAAPAPAIERLWRPVLQSNDSVLVVTETLMAAAPAQPDLEQGRPVVTETIDPKLFLNVQEVSAKLAVFLNSHGKAPELELARNVTVPRLRRGPFILLGAFNNPLTRRSVSSFRFYLDLDRERLIRRIVDRQDPSRNWAAPMVPGLTTDYALIARAADPGTGQTMLALAGLGERGSAAAMEFVTNPKYLARIEGQLPRGWERRNLELVIQTKLISEDWGEPQLVASCIW
jgi:hypothetical protein